MSPDIATPSEQTARTPAQSAFLQVQRSLARNIIGQATLIDRLLIALLAALTLLPQLIIVLKPLGSESTTETV